MRWTEGFIAVDWGTTNRRGYLLRRDGTLDEELEDDKGILSVSPDGFPEAVEDLRQRLGDMPMLMAGMIGSNRGWVEARYAACPTGAEELARHLTWAEPGRVAIVPGVSYLAENAADVMRGEEVQVVGAVAAAMVPPTGLICHPGTHTKWVEVIDGRITRFRTVMTGELFSLLKQHSILSDLLVHPVTAGPVFESGVARGLEGVSLTAELFSVRARVLLGRTAPEEASSFTSGLLIGADIGTGLAMAQGEPVHVMGRPELTALFSAALRFAGRTVGEVDGEEAFLAGSRKIAELIA